MVPYSPVLFLIQPVGRRSYGSCKISQYNLILINTNFYLHKYSHNTQHIPQPKSNPSNFQTKSKFPSSPQDVNKDHYVMLTYLNNNQYQHIEIMIKTFIIVALLAIYSTNALYFGITGKPFCFDIEEEPGKTIKFFYEVTGEKPEETQVHIISANQNSAISLSGANNKTEQSGDSALNVCFVSTDGGYKSVSVDFYTHDKAHLLELAKKSEIYELHTKLIDVGEGLKEISKNEHFEEQRQKIHAEIITEHENKVKNFAVIKLLAIVVVAVGQLYLLKKMLDKQGQGYQPV